MYLDIATQAVGVIIALATGGVLTIGSLKIHLAPLAPFRQRVIDLIVTKQDAVKVLGDLESEHIATVILARRDRDQYTEPKVHVANEKAVVFYGVNRGSDLIGKNRNQLIELLAGWMDERDETAFRQDQVRIAMEMANQPSNPVRARKPIRFNSSHPTFPNQSFLPIVAHNLTHTDRNNRSEIYTIVLYLKADLFRELLVDYAEI